MLPVPSPWQKIGGLCAHPSRHMNGKIPAKIEDLLNIFLPQGLKDLEGLVL